MELENINPIYIRTHIIEHIWRFVYQSDSYTRELVLNLHDVYILRRLRNILGGIRRWN